MKIYTKTGDRGETALFGGNRIAKNSLRITAIGHVDELNSTLGIVISELNQETSSDLIKLLLRVQSDLLRVGADLATPLSAIKMYQEQVNRIDKDDVVKLEKEIDIWDKSLPKLTQFILPGGTEAASHTHQARSVCRRAERKIVELSLQEEVNSDLLKFVNRLSDWLFVLGRFINQSENIGDTFAVEKN
ncbi:cob(I)yrinic acid a,c-diamide adenosyltransferase [Candidatus Dojkabacteria bacterium]|uniref:Corrinoid adenosyltransferase n=1 Tax=Candidatus Dojkabacteria bacterium TaxID=2099670 RepID=A0A955LA28_9BACT|nr:cob(I)yrinic acid a,c-diamide adenosyltransferase [Candidatus Dojkabacteria bacterium]